MNHDDAERITTNPDLCGGRPCVRGMRIRVVDVLGMLASGLTRDQILEEMPDLTPEDISACLRYARSRVDAAAEGATFEDLLAASLGTWEAEDGLEYQRRLRGEW